MQISADGWKSARKYSVQNILGTIPQRFLFWAYPRAILSWPGEVEPLSYRTLAAFAYSDLKGERNLRERDSTRRRLHHTVLFCRHRI